MTDDQHLRDLLEGAVPEPPEAGDVGRRARERWRRARRRRWAAVAFAAVVVAAVPAVHALGGHNKAQELPGSTVGSGSQACHRLQHRDGLGYLVDVRVVEASIARRWSSELGGSGDQPVTVCVLARDHPTIRETVVALRAGHHPLVVTQGSYAQTASVMVRLGELQEQQTPSLSNAPFRCPASGDDNVDLPGSATLPEGATSVRMCSDGSYYPQQVLTTGVGSLVTAINSRPLTYWRGSTCAGVPGIHGYTLVFGYPHGTRLVEADGCGWIGVGPVQHSESEPTVGDRFLAALANQLGGVTAPARCPGTSQAPADIGDLTHITAARFCPAGSTGSGDLLSTSQLGVLVRGTNYYDGSTTTIEGACTEPAAGWPHLMLADAWHEQFSVTLECRHLRFWRVRAPDEHGKVVTVLVSGVRGLLRRLAHSAR